MACHSIAKPGMAPGVPLPFSFVVLWSSGYIGGAVGLNYAEPFTMTFLRFALAGVLLLLIAVATRAPWPASRREAGHIAVVGLLIQAVQFGGLYSGMNAGVSAGVSALIVGLMPILTALGAGWFLGERVSRRQWFGLCLGLAGVVAVVGDRLTAGGDAGGFLLVGLALFGITAGTLYQKKFCAGMDLRTGGFIQMAVGALALLVLAGMAETMEIRWTAGFVGSLAWLAVMNSIGAVSLLFVMIRRGEATRVASLFYLIPPMTALMASVVLAEMPGLATVAGFALAALGVRLGTRS
ncbi:DMT family transporter [Arenibaculum sp.]|jgi:drug/metabolite transporter (DMT)-like permease|uniref:DMT family transporter n=1 Tax=Arenibaculum sp. TaxID=2865862 RepID=UPI002E132F14|nr:DMT family transporter [Arenibaculum sp.]